MASTPYSNSNGRVTNAILGTKLDSAIEKLDRLDRRVQFLEEKMDVDLHEQRAMCGENASQIARLEERQKAWTGILGALTLIGTTIGSAFGFVK